MFESDLPIAERRSLVRVYREQNMTLVLVTHDMSIAQRASRTIQMKDGRVVSDRESTIGRSIT
jgi:predicted ABC-type transport system involved in lysophospholipase L1 biosynthesis ATPase subunit